MILYVVMVAVSMLFAVYAKNARPLPALKTTYCTLAVLSALPFVLVTVLRYRVGTDWTYVYEPHFYYIRHGITGFSEGGFNLLYKFFALFTEDAWWVIAFVGLVTMVLFFTAIYQQSCMIPFSILLFFISNRYFTALNQIRQMLAMSMFVYSLKYIQQRKWKAYFVWNLLGFSIHTSSIIYFPLYFVYGYEVSWKKCAAILGIFTAGYPVLRVVLPRLASFTRFAWYLSSAFQQNDFYLMGFLVTLFLTLLHLFVLMRYPAEDKEYSFYCLAMTFSTVILMFSSVLPQVLRMSEALSVVQLFSLPKLFQKEKNDALWLFMWLLAVAVLTAKLLYDVYVNHWYDVLPYHTVFFR